MRLFEAFFPPRRRTASVAKERLQIIMAHERSDRSRPDYIPMLQKELVEVILKYVKIEKDQVKVKLDKSGDCSVLEVNVELPAGRAVASPAAAAPAPAR
jgi:cell division topological specificity factor